MSAKKPAAKQKAKGPHKATGGATPPEQPPRPLQRRYKSAAEVLEDLLPALTAVAGATRGRAKDGSWRALYIEALGSCANVTIAARVAGVSRQAVHQARSDAEFVAAERDAIDRGIDLVEASAFKSAVYGDLETVYHQGIPCGEVLKYSDAMRALLLKGRRPEVYRDKIGVEHSGEVRTHLTLEQYRARVLAAKANRPPAA